MKTSEKFVQANKLMRECEKLYEDALKEIQEKTGREYTDEDNTLCICMTQISDVLSYFVGTSILNE